ncbi:MAG: hypothetical protein HY770_04905 [Chitinivibrionia bacterium]|nr:hypothetical protein [Chitinivibrionia bacterium]
MESGNHISILSDNRREIEPTFFFMMNCLIYSRIETDFGSNRDFYDEDVNMYLGYLLTSFMKPEYHRMARKYLSKYDSDLFERVRNSSDVRLKYTIYKTNADFLLISIGIFKESLLGGPGSIPLYRNSEEAHMGRGKTYYQFAYSYSQSMFRKPAAISDVLEKLSRGFEQYVEVLSHMRGEYFNILDRLSDGEVYHMERSIDAFTQNEELKRLQDQFLDLYSEYLKSGDPRSKAKLKELVRTIRGLDESFHFSIED